MDKKIFSRNGEIWPDDNGVHINAHGGGIYREGNTFYWYGEHKIEGKAGNRAWVGVHVYTSEDLFNWHDAGIALDIRDGREPGLVPGCVIERPKVVRNPSGRYVMWFHLEEDAECTSAIPAVAVSDSPLGPFHLLSKNRPNAGIWPQNVPAELKKKELIDKALKTYGEISHAENDITPQVSVLGMCLPTGQESRDMTVFIDDDARGYLIYSSEKNATTHIAELNDDYTACNGRYWRAFPWRWMEAPVVFRRHGKYYFIGSGCTWWYPNAARSAVADSITGPWTEFGNPAVDKGGETTYGSQGTYALKLSEDEIIFMADSWRWENAIDGRYLWLPIEWKNERPVIRKDKYDEH